MRNGKRNVVIQGIAASDQDILKFIENPSKIIFSNINRENIHLELVTSVYWRALCE